MKIAAFVFALATTAALAGAPAEPVEAVSCQGRALLVPTVTRAAACSCAGRVTLAERRMARRAARSNAATTRAAFIDAARMGTLNGCAGNAVAMPTMVSEPACKSCK